MPNSFDAKAAYARHRLERASEDLATARLLLEEQMLRAANNRAYYSIFHCLRAVLALDGYDSSKHSGIISEFRKRYVKTGIVPVEVSDAIGEAFDIRTASDYDDLFETDEEETRRQVENAAYVYGVAVTLLEPKVAQGS